ncbi:MAG: hypothetical protein A3E79_00160 [Burkholderiales bacterium RIFCSPHIGHO2_12_FULL_61_11]|nr:MAG: hypothetical protein A3E79_00160 [Burkholderiales bacterium RIFCSPHIGHO2_12_FULL_61_11]
MNPITIVLAISLLANAAQGYAYLGKRDTAVVATTNLTHAAVAVTNCNASVDNLGSQTEKRATAAAPARAAAAARAVKGNAKADVILSTPPEAPGNDCKSATARANDWFKDTP